MAATSFVTWLVVAGVVLWALLLVGFERRRRAMRRPPTPPPALTEYPSLAVIHPIRGLDPGVGDNVAAALDIAYAGSFENLFVFDGADEPAVPIVRAAIAEHTRAGRPGSARVLIAGPPPQGYTGKLAAMLAGVEATESALVAFVDSDVRVDPHIVRVLIDLLSSRPDAGAAFAPVVVSEPPRTPGDVGYELMLNSLYSPEVALWAQAGRDIPFIMGQLMVFRRDTLESIGGVDCARGQIVDDMRIGARVVAAGLKNVIASQPIRIVEGGVTQGEFARSARRWLVFSRTGIPARFGIGAAFHFLAFWTGLVDVIAGFVVGSALTAFVGSALVLSSAAVLLALNRATGGPRTPPRWWWMALVVLFCGPFVYATTWIWPEVRWRGRVYALNAKAELDDEPAPLFDRIRRALRAALHLARAGRPQIK